MGRFSDIMEKKGIDDVSPSKQSPSKQGGYLSMDTLMDDDPGSPEATAKSEWLVYNGQLGSPSKGLKFRASPDVKDVLPSRKLVEFGETVFGVPTDNGFLKVGKLYLPMKVNDVHVLVPQNLAPSDDEDPTDMWKTWKMPAPLTDPPKCAGKGKLYEVIHDIVIGRPAPSTAAPMQCVRKKGQIVELFDFDETGKWRRGLHLDTNHLVWFLLDHPEIGPLLRPQGQPLSVAPMDHVCVAAAENLVDNLTRFLDMGSQANVYDVTGRTPLMLAAENNNVICLVLLVEGGADPSLRSKAPCNPPGKSAVEMTKNADTKELLKAICAYKDFDMRALDQVTFMMPPAYQETIDRLLEAAGRAVQKGNYLVEGKEGPPLDSQPANSFAASSQHNPQPAHSQPAPRAPPANSSSAGQIRREPVVHSDGTHTNARRGRGVLHEVVYSAVWIRKQATVDASKIAVKKQGELVELFESDESGDWARVEHEVYEGHYLTGWMLVKHETLGMLLEPVQQGRAF